MQSFPPAPVQPEHPQLDTSLKAMLHDMQDQLYHIKITQYQATDRIGRVDDRVRRIEQQLQQNQQVDMPRLTGKSPAPVSSSDV